MNHMIPQKGTRKRDDLSNFRNSILTGYWKAKDKKKKKKAYINIVLYLVNMFLTGI